MGKNSWWSRGTTKNKVERDADIPETVRDWELEKGGWRYDDKNVGYNLSWEDLLEYERVNITMESDEEFDQWFADFRASRGITARSFAGSLSSWKSDESWDIEEKPKSKWLSGWWASDVYKGFKGSTGDATKLALVLQAVQTTVRVVDDTVPALHVAWADNEMSYTDFKAHKIAINPAPVMDKSMEDGEAIDITTGFGLHEASHSEYSREPYETILKPTELSPMQVAGMLLNFVEDIRIEAMTTEKFPGFAGYFEKSLAWAWGKSKAHLPAEYGPKLMEKMNAVLVIIRFPDGPAALKHPSFAAEIPWWTKWRDDYLEERVNARDTIQRGIDHLAEDPETKKEMEEMAENEEAMKKAGEELRKLLDRLTKEGLGKLLIKSCVNDVDKKLLEDGEAQEVERLVSERLEIESPFIKTHSGGGNHKLYITKPLEDARSRGAYIGKPKPILSRLKAALLFRQELPRYTTRLLKRGGLDDEELWRWADQDYRVFQEETIAARPQTQMTLLVDMSGSMYGSKLRIAQELAQLFVWALRDMEGVDTKVFGHTGDNNDAGGSVDIYKLWEYGEPLTRLGLITTLDHGNNYDGHAIAWTIKEILQRGQPEEQRIILVLSDGYPSGINYGGSPGEAHVKQVTTWADKNGVQVIQIAIDSAVDASRQARMFKRFIPYTDMNELPKQLTKLLSQLT